MLRFVKVSVSMCFFGTGRGFEMCLLGKHFESMHILDTKSGARFWRICNGKVGALGALEIVHDSPKIPAPCRVGSSRALARAGFLWSDYWRFQRQKIAPIFRVCGAPLTPWIVFARLTKRDKGFKATPFACGHFFESPVRHGI